MTKYTMDELSIEITYACDMRCKHCSSSAGERMEDELTTERILGIIDESIRDCGTTSFSISGGDPLCHPDLFRIMDHAWARGLQVLLYTSGVVKVEGEYRGIWPALAKSWQKYADAEEGHRWGRSTADKFKVIFGVHGATPEVHDEITQIEGSWECQQEAIVNCVTAGLYVACHFVPTALNYKEIPAVVNWFNELGAHEISLLRYVPQGRGLDHDDELRMTREQFAELQEIIVEQSRRAEGWDIKFRPGIPIDFTFLCFGGWSKPKPCDGGKTKILVRPNGEVNVCPAWKDLPKYVAGNLAEESVKRVWEESPVYRMFREFLPDDLKGKCKTCQNVQECWGGCAAQRILAHGDIAQGPDPLCFRKVTDD